MRSNFWKTLFLIVMFAFSGCNIPKENNSIVQVDSIAAKKDNAIDKSQFYIKTDSIILRFSHFDTIVYSRKDFNEIVDNFPALYEELPVDPDISYARSGSFKNILELNGDRKQLSFNSQSGQDEYYILYAYFLKKKNEGSGVDVRREKLISIYLDLNEIFRVLSYGGTYFGHQRNRINGYAEYGIYQFKEYKESYNQLIDIKSQKKLYLASIKQFISDNIEVDMEITDKALKDRRQIELFGYVSHIDSLISDNFYLKKAQEFQYSYY